MKNKEKYVLYASIILIYIIALMPLLRVWINVADDMDNFIYAINLKSQFLRDYQEATMQGRFYFLITRFFYYIPLMVNSKIYFSLFLIIPMIITIILFLIFVQKLFNNKTLTFLSSILIPAIIQFLGYHSITTSYPLYFLFSFSLILISFILIIEYLDKKKINTLILSSIIIFVSYLFYEAYLSYFFIILFIILFKTKADKQENRLKQIVSKIKKNKAIILINLSIILVYIIIYIGFRIAYPSQYYGNRLTNERNLFILICSIFELGAFSIPLFSFFSYQNFLPIYSNKLNNLSLLQNIEPSSYLFAILISVMIFFILKNYQKIRKDTLILGLITGFLFYILPAIALTLSSKYLEQKMYNYVTTFLSLFGIIIFLSSLVLLVLNLLSKKKILTNIFIILFTIGVFLTSLLTNHTNNIITKDLEATKYRFDLVEYGFKNIIKNPKLIPICLEGANKTTSFAGSFVLSPKFEWRDYIKRVTGLETKSYNGYNCFFKEYKDSDSLVLVSFFSQAQKTNDAIMFFAKLKGKDLPQRKEDILCDNIVVLYLSSYKTFSISLANKDGSEVYLNNEPLQSYGNLHLGNIISNLRDNISSFELSGKDMIVSSLNISNILVNAKSYNIKSKQERIRDIILTMQADTKWRQALEEKAKKNSISLRQQMYLDAKYMLQDSN